jgi:hypothetical protein
MRQRSGNTTHTRHACISSGGEMRAHVCARGAARNHSGWSHKVPSSLLKSAAADAGHGGKRQESAVYTGVNEHFESFSNAEQRRPSVFQQTARTTLQRHKPARTGKWLCCGRDAVVEFVCGFRKHCGPLARSRGKFAGPSARALSPNCSLSRSDGVDISRSTPRGGKRACVVVVPAS